MMHIQEASLPYLGPDSLLFAQLEGGGHVYSSPLSSQ